MVPAWSVVIKPAGRSGGAELERAGISSDVPIALSLPDQNELSRSMVRRGKE